MFSQTGYNTARVNEALTVDHYYRYTKTEVNKKVINNTIFYTNRASYNILLILHYKYYVIFQIWIVTYIKRRKGDLSWNMPTLLTTLPLFRQQHISKSLNTRLIVTANTHHRAIKIIIILSNLFRKQPQMCFIRTL